MTSDLVNTALVNDIRQVGGLENLNYGQEPIFEALSMSNSPPTALRPVLTSEYANITLGGDIPQVGDLVYQNYGHKPFF